MRWSVVPLGSVATLARDGIAPKKIVSGTPFVGLENIRKGGDIEGVVPVNSGDIASTKFSFSDRHVLYGKLRPYLAKIALPEFEGICSTDIIPILPGMKLDRRFLAHYLLTPKMVAFASDRATGANLPRLSPKVMLEFPIPLPPIEEQRRIAGILDRAEELRAKRRSAIALLDQLPQAIFLEMFGDPTINERCWTVCTIGDSPIKIADGNYSAKYPTSSEFVAEGVPFIRANNFKDLSISKDEMRFISIEKHSELRKGHLIEHDVLITTRGEIGNIAIVPSDFIGANINAQIVLLRPERTFMNYLFLAYHLRFPSTRSLIQSFQNGVALKQLPIHQLRRIPLAIPPIDIQLYFAARVQAIHRAKAAHQSALSELDALFASLQSKAFSGELSTSKELTHV